MSVIAYEYAAFGRKFRVEQIESTKRWHAIGRAAGMNLYILDKIGDDAEQDGMQRKLDAWARRQGCRPINTQKVRQETLGI